MTKDSTARGTLEAARFFLEKAELTGISDRKPFQWYLEAAISVGRNVTWHIKKEYSHQPGFQAWYSGHESMMAADPIFSFFRDTRNFIVKEGPVGVHRVVHLSGVVTATGDVTVEVRVIRGKPWYRRSTKIIWEDLRASVLQPLHKWRRRRALAQRRRARAKRKLAQAHADESTSEAIDGFYFDEPEWKDRPALELLREYVDKLEAIVEDAEARFGDGSS